MKTLIDFEQQQPLPTRFFTQALQNHCMVNAYIFRGKDFATSYRLVLRLAQIINCSQRPNPAAACGQCQSCRWIEDNAHPGVMTVSNLTYLPDIDPETGTSKTKSGKPSQVIKVDQLDNLLNELALHSGGFHRIIILTGAQECPATEHDVQPFPPPKDWRQTEGVLFDLLPLDRKVFPDKLANKFLKTLEEPPLDVLFFLLTDSEDKLLDTIVSRCQLVPFNTPASCYTIDLSPIERETFGTLFAPGHYGDFLAQTTLLNQLVADTGIDLPDVLTRLQAFLQEQLETHVENAVKYQRIKRLIMQVEHAKNMIRDRVKEEPALEEMFLSFSLS